MMYTPTPAARRPRPPSRSRAPLGDLPGKAPSSSPCVSATTRSTLNSSGTNRLPTSHSDTSIASSSLGDTPLTHQVRRRKELARSDLARISASPADLGDISMGLDIDPQATLSSKRRVLGLGLPSPLASQTNLASMDSSNEAEPSPPPPYGPTVPSNADVGDAQPAPTPLRQDSGTYSRHSSMSSRASSADSFRVEERRRARRATDAASLMGLEVDFASGSESRDWSPRSEDAMSEATMRARMLEMRRQLKRRETELLVAAEVANRALRTHEDLLAYLPSTVKARLPEFVHLFPPYSQEDRHSNREHLDSSSSEFQQHPSHGHRPASSNSTATPSAGPMTTSSTARSSQLPDPSPPLTDSDFNDGSDSHDDFATADDEPAAMPQYRTIRPSGSRRDRSQSRPRGHLTRQHGAHASISSRRAVSPRQAEMDALRQAEMDDRILALEQAVNDAREGEENQRKLAARLRKEVDKLHRDFDRAEEDRELAERAPPMGTPGLRGNLTKAIFMPRSATNAAYVRPARPTPSASKDTMGWGSTSFPQFPAGQSPQIPKHLIHADEDDWPDLGEYTDRLRRATPDRRRYMPSPSVSRTSSNMGTLSKHPTPAGSTIRSRQAPSQASTSSRRRGPTDKLTLPAESRKMRRKISQTSFLHPDQSVATPPKRELSSVPLQPRLTVEAPDSGSSRSSSSQGSPGARQSISGSRTMRRSPWPSPHGSIMSRDPSPNARSTLSYSVPRDSLSPAFASLSSRMESMRAFVSSALEGSPSRPTTTRTLGSELGSEYGERADSSLRYIEETLLLTRPSPSRTHLSADDEAKSVFSEGFYQPAAPLPPRVSAALSSLAMALAPYTSPAAPHTISGLPGSSYGDRSDSDNVFDDAFAMRKIRWADTTKSSMDSTGSDEFTTESVFTLPPRTNINSSTSSQGTSATVASKILKYQGISPRPRARPSSFRNSSDGSISLAHRRRLSQQIVVKSAATQTLEPEDESVWEVISDDKEPTAWYEPRTIPGRLVHDLICLMAILVDFVECAVVVIYRVVLDMRYGQRNSLLGVSKRAKMRRYYL